MPKPSSENSRTGCAGKLATLLVWAAGTDIPGTESFPATSDALFIVATVVAVGAACFTVVVAFGVVVAFTVVVAVGAACFTVVVAFGVVVAFTVVVAVGAACFTVVVAFGVVVAFTVVVGVTVGAGVAVGVTVGDGVVVGVAVTNASLSVFQLPPLLKSMIELYCRYTKKPPLSQAVLTDVMLLPSGAVFPRFAEPTASLYHAPDPPRAPPVSSQCVCSTGAFPSSPIQMVGYGSFPGPALESHAI
jgi:hypothetical protein